MNEEDVQQRAIIDRSTKGTITFFTLSSVVWLVLSTLLGLIASIKQHDPEWLNCDWLQWLNWGRLQPAFISALVYGWAFQAAFAISLFIMSRVCRSVLKNGVTMIIIGHLWNLGVTLALATILGGAQHAAELLEFGTGPALLMLGSFIGIAVWIALKFVGRPNGADYVSQWYILGAILWFPLLMITALIFTRGGQGSGLHAAAIGSWYGATVVQWFLVPMGLAAAYYIVPKIVNRPIHSYPMAKAGFWGLAFLGGLTGLQKFVGGPYPQLWAGMSVLAQWLLLVPICFVAGNFFQTIGGRAGLIHSSPSLRFVFGGVVFLILGHLVAAVTAGFPGLLSFTHAQDAAQTAVVYGGVSMIFFGAIYFILPRLTGCEWLASSWIRFHFWMNVYGIGAIIIILVSGGIAQGQAASTWNDGVEGLFTNVRGFVVGRSVGWFFILLANVIFFFHVILMALRLGRRSDRPTLLGHHPDWDKSEVSITPEGAEAR